jgi:hypothetical protein
MSITNQAYAFDRGRCFSSLLYFPGERYSFYINFDTPIADPAHATFRLDLYKEESNVSVAENIGELHRDIIDPVDAPDFYNIYCPDFVFPAVPLGYYQFVIFDTAAQVIKCRSNSILVEEKEYAPNVTKVFFRNSYNKYGFNYEGLPDYYNVFTLPIIQVGYGIDSDNVQYRNAHNKKLRNYNLYMDNRYKLETYKADELGHKGCAAMYSQDTVFINETFINVKEPYTVEDNKASVLTKGNVVVVEDETVEHPLPTMLYQPHLVTVNGRDYDPADYNVDEYH